MNKDEDNQKVILEDPEDREILNSLLNEYSEKLIRFCHKINNYQKTNLLYIGFCFASVIIIISIFLLRINNLSSLPLLWARLSIVILGGIVSFCIPLIFQITQQLNLLNRDAKIVAIKLEKVLRAASQIHDHSVKQRFVVRLELELRLADAESALRYYEIITKRDRKSQEKELRSQENELHRLTKELESLARVQREKAILGNNYSSVERYNEICDLLDHLNQELKQEPQTFFSGMIPPTWRKIL